MKPGALRLGYTTGACAAAAARAATIALLRQEPISEVEVSLPAGKASFKLRRCTFDPTQASCSVIKDAGDDPDVTNGAEVCATVRWREKPGIEIRGGEGVGVVTKPGLQVPVGLPAINPAPREMIENAIREVMPINKGVVVTISVPGGEQLAKRTLNPRLGIAGGISILGTTGIVIPYSVNAYKACISQALDVALACGCRQVVLTTGRRSEKFAQQELILPEECFILVGDFIGYSLIECAKRAFDKVTIWGMIGKLSKLAAGQMDTNVSEARVNINFLAQVAKSCGLPDEIVRTLRRAVTASHLVRIIPPEYTKTFCDRVCLMAAERCRQEVGAKFEVECIMSSYQGIILGRANAKG